MASRAVEKTFKHPCWFFLICCLTSTGTHVDGKFLRVLQNMYSNIKSCVTVAGEDSPFFFSNRGVRQGDNISPVLFSLFLNDLENHLIADHAEGVRIECTSETLYYFIKIFVLLYADDTVILADSAEDLQKSLDFFSHYCTEWKLKVNESKTKVVIFGARRIHAYFL